MAEDEPARPADHPLWSFAVRVLVAVGIALLVFLLWQIRQTVLLAFAAVIVAVLLLALAVLVRRVLPVGHRWALGIAITVVLLAIGGFGWLMGAQIQQQVSELWDRLPQGLRTLEEIAAPLIGGEAGEPGGADQSQQTEGDASDRGGEGAGGFLASRLTEWIAAYAMPVVDAVVGVVLVAIAGVFLASQPGLYRRGLSRLFPKRQQARAEETMADMGRALHLWLIGELISMTIIGVLVGLGTWAIGLPSPLALGLFAFLTEFVPILGPIIGAVPALLLALTEGWTTVLWTLALFVVVQQLESNLIAPIVQERMVTIPPAVLLLAVAAFGGLFGILGIIVAAPLAVVVYVGVQRLWVREALGEDIPVAGER